MSEEIVINERAQRLLKSLVESYIRGGQPVGSKSLLEESGLQVSSATVRNVMAELEELGLVASPHTSAGRVPTDLGLRFFVDSLLTVQPLSGEEVESMRQSLGADQTMPQLLNRTSSMLSGITRMAGLVMLPRRGRLSLRHIEFLPLGDRRILVIWVINDNDVQNRIVQMDRDYSAEELVRMAAYLNSHFNGLEVEEIKQRVIIEMEQTKEQANQLMLTAIELARQAFDGEGDEADYVLEGETNLFGYAEMADMDKLRKLFDAFEQKRQVLQLLEGATSTEGIQIFIGEESGYKVFDGCSLVTSPYKVEEEVVGVLGVIGPSRMEYQRVIPIVDVTAKLLSAALNRQ
ncbi:MAG: heat-inducible transcription repressor HrcA [Gammaproteobacteria bacterium]|nr:heat-inducible transcription repressor HrcA [Gammaproteobacteria bacterium]